MRKGNLLLLLLIVCFTSCEMLESHPYDAHITGERGINAKNCERIEEAMKGKKTFRFAMISDTQRWYDETEKVVEKIDVYKAIYGNPNFAFTAGNVRFICLNTNAMEYDYSQPVPDFGFMEDELTNLPEGIEKTVFLMHVKPYEFIFNNNVARVFQEYVKQFPNVQFCLYGHEHQLTVDDLFGDGILYYQCPNIGKRTYLVFTIKEGTHEYDYEAVEF